MTRLGWFHGVVLVAFWLAGLSAFLIGGLSLAGRVFQVFLVVVVGWVGRELYRECWESLKAELYRERVFREWRRVNRLKGMD